MLRKILTFFQKETVLSISAILAILSMFIVHPSGKYFSYIDFRTLSLLFCLMSIVAGLSEIGLFDYLAEKILSRANSIKSIIVLLVLLCFFFSMIITNDVALITFVPLAIIILKKMSEKQNAPQINGVSCFSGKRDEKFRKTACQKSGLWYIMNWLRGKCLFSRGIPH